ncbi:hypothetical protein ATANTOWER_019086 [Ataeniobius toweri]|uniref:Prolactin receptor n=1 Tax=Ataeniobius toweri TaxID=208326 RepID=A0ABU7BZY2_9TELE|nr:hypothetical protein [Ataeniobius toweri]
MLMGKEEAPVDHRPCVGLHDPKPPHIKEGQEGVYTNLGREQLNGKEKIDAIRFPVTKDMDKDWKESRAPESDKNITKPFSCSEFAEQFFHPRSLQKHRTDSEMGSSSALDDAINETLLPASPCSQQFALGRRPAEANCVPENSL